MKRGERYFGFRGGWLTFWVTVACATDMTLVRNSDHNTRIVADIEQFGYDQGVFGGVVVTDDFLETLNIVGDTSMISTVSALYAIGWLPLQRNQANFNSTCLRSSRLFLWCHRGILCGRRPRS